LILLPFIATMARAFVLLAATLPAFALADAPPAAPAAVPWPPPAWAYPVNPPGFAREPAEDVPLHVPHSRVTLRAPQVRDAFFAPDWHPEDHPPMPAIVATGRRPGVQACGYCHRADGPGGPENSSLAGLPAAYIERQIADFRSGARSTSVPARLPPLLMIALAKEMDDAEVVASAAYFSRLKPRFALRVIEAARVPRTHVAGWFLAVTPGAGTEPIDGRIIEVPRDLTQFESRDARSRFVAWVPPGSIARGRALVRASGPDGCVACHGPTLHGTAEVPSIAGRSPSYIVRQLYDFRSGARTGTNAAPMQAVVARLDEHEMTAVAAYLATLR
jgi:cytochrome c553